MSQHISLAALHNLSAKTKFTWEQGEIPGVQILQGATLFVALGAAPKLSREGRFMAQIVPCTGPQRKRPGWPRFYFNEDRAKLELEEWMVLNGEMRLALNIAKTQIEETHEQEQAQTDVFDGADDNAQMGARHAG